MRNVAHCTASMKQNLEHRFEAWLHKDGDENSFAAQAVGLSTNDDRKDGVRSVGNKRQKRESEKKIFKRHFFRVKKADVQFESVKMNTLVLRGSQQRVNGKIPKHCVICSMYNFRKYTALGIGIVDVQSIPCSCQ